MRVKKVCTQPELFCAVCVGRFVFGPVWCGEPTYFVTPVNGSELPVCLGHIKAQRRQDNQEVYVAKESRAFRDLLEELRSA